MTAPHQPGWYDDPDSPNAQRYWDGQSWTPHRQRKPASLASHPPTQAQAPVTPAAPPPPPPAHALPPPPTGAQPPGAPRDKFGVSKVALVLAGLALVLAITALVAGRVEFGTFLWGILVVAAIAIIAAFFTLRSHQSVPHKAMVVTAIVLVVAAAIPASLKLVYPVYDHFLGKKSAQASHAGTGGPASGPQGAGSDAPSGAPPQAPSGAPPQAPSGGARSGILVTKGGKGSDTTYGFLDPSSGKYSEVASFHYVNMALAIGEPAVSPDFTKVAVLNQGKIGWVDTSGKFTDVTPTVDPGAFGGNPPSYEVVGFDEAGSFYYIKTTSQGMETYKLPAGSTTNAQKISSGMLVNYTGSLGYDGSMHIGCSAVNWLGPNNSVSANGTQINKQAITGSDEQGCATSAYGTMPTPLLPKTNTATVTDAVGNHDGTKVAFKYYGRDTGGASQQGNASLYIVAADGSGEPTKVNLTGVSGEDLSKMAFVKWI
jgi:hypothetical protein